MVKLLDRLKAALKVFAIYIAFCGIFGFSAFVGEEASQVVMFGVWQSIDVGQWQNVKKAIDLKTRIIRMVEIINYSGGWLNPFGFISYKAYVEADRFYIQSLRDKCFAHAPELFIGEEVEFQFTPQKTYPENDNNFNWWVAKTGKILVLTDNQLPLGKMSTVSGELTSHNDMLFIDLRD